VERLICKYYHKGQFDHRLWISYFLNGIALLLKFLISGKKVGGKLTSKIHLPMAYSYRRYLLIAML
jgi:hypothetical protein